MSQRPHVSSEGTKKLFRTGGQQELFGERSVEEDHEQLVPGAAKPRGDGLEARRPVECLGITFESEEARRAYFTDRLREELQDPAFRQQPGFPLGSDEDILRLSDPPYYTACPNPFLAEFVRRYGRQHDATVPYRVEPFAVDISEGRNDDIYTAHPYHTKVPPKAIARLIMHYTQPGDLVLDAFAGSGMTGIAAAMCADSSLANECGSIAGHRASILCDLSPAATFISATYLAPPDVEAFSLASEALLAHADHELNQLWVAPSLPPRAQVDFVAWAESFSCPHCLQPVASDRVLEATATIGAAADFPCPHCASRVSKAPTAGSHASRLIRRFEARFDPILARPTNTVVRDPVLAQVRDHKGRRLVQLSRDDQRALLAFDGQPKHWYPSTPLVQGERYRFKDYSHAYGITHVHHFYTRRQLITYSTLWHVASIHKDHNIRRSLQFFISSNASGLTVMNRYVPRHYSHVNQTLSGTLYTPSMVAETSHRYTYNGKRKRLIKAFNTLRNVGRPLHSVSTQSATSLKGIPDNTIDYIFVDPPFGRNLQYSELNQIWEAWLRVRTDREPEAVMDASRGREVMEYAALMRHAFTELCRVLKPGRWLTVEFHNSSNVVWMAIQEAITAAGFVIADVRVLDKERETYKQSREGLVQRDLIISAYKPTGDLEARFRSGAATEVGIWDFVRTHLRQLPVFSTAVDGRPEQIAERRSFLLFDRMIAFHVQRGVGVPVSAAEFTSGLAQRFPERDGMYFLPDQVAEYDRRRLEKGEPRQLEFVVRDEASAIQWLRDQLEREPQTVQDLTPNFMRELSSWAKHEQRLELSDLLRENFLRQSGTSPIAGQVMAWMKKAPGLREKARAAEAACNYETGDLRTTDPELLAAAKDRWYVPDPNRMQDLEKLRERELLDDFEQYKAFTGRRLKTFRLEAVRAGFKKAWAEKDYSTILAVAAKIPENVLQEDQKLLMWYDQAQTRAGTTV